MNAIEEGIVDVLVDQFSVDRTAATPEATFESLEFDSLVLIEFGLVVGKRFGIAIADDELADDMTIRDLAVLAAAKGAVT
ncbi:MAG: acyl carrier protein [Saccharothrix sp.]|nr:acyl carrier protein [Saccharothrix sp.]